MTNKNALYLYNSACGIGDAVCAMYAACGLADSQKKEVVLQTLHPEWLSRVEHPRVTITTLDNLGADMGVMYKEQCRESAMGPTVSRAQFYCDRISDFYDIDPFTPKRPDKIHSRFNRIPGLHRYVVLVPFANELIKEWPAGHWNHLAGLIRDAGFQVVAISDTKRKDRLLPMFDDHVRFYHGQSTSWVLDVLFGATLVIGNDSGIPHVCGLYSIPCVSIIAHFSPEFTFAHSKNLLIATPDESVQCRWCGHLPEKGFRGEKCGVPCSALMGIGPERVMSIALPMVK